MWSGRLITHLLHKLVAITAWAYLAFIAYATLSPIQARHRISSADVEHSSPSRLPDSCLVWPIPDKCACMFYSSWKCRTA
jgi:hypothetical protein